ncbi:hypothetical protein HK104_004474 [Borealophlyctis nickersoniae]|nr:hypothetical protein HK104_004474 [Borealophlyctis nickersoniae]
MDTAVAENLDVVLDSLPYVDPDIATDDVDRLIAEELEKHTGETKSALPLEIELFKDHPALVEELVRVEQGKKLQAIDVARFRLEPPKQANPRVADWRAAVEASQAQLEHQHNRLINLELINKFGPNAWRLHNFQLEHAVSMLQAEGSSTKLAVVQLNKQRKVEQMKAGNSLQALEARWQSLLHGVISVDAASAALEGELESLRQIKAQLESS